MANIYLIRHGQASFGQQNYDELSPLGEKQAQRLGETLSTRIQSFDKVILGSMFRHKQTAQNCLSSMGIPFEQEAWLTDERWNEYDHQDILTQCSPEFSTPEGIQQFIRQQSNPKAAFEALFNEAMNRWIKGEHDDDYVESWQHYQQRINDAVSHIFSLSRQHKNIAVFTSGGPISVVSQKLLGVAPEKIMQLNWTLLNCSVTKIVSTSNRQFVATLNEHSHFEGEHHSLLSYK